jgi:hypothetical protein
VDEQAESIRFGVISEGATDFYVIKHLLEGVFGSDGHYIQVNSIFPDLDASHQQRYGGWTLLKKFLNDQRHINALDFNDFIVIQIDTDVSEEKGFDVPHRGEKNQNLPILELIHQVREKLQSWMNISENDNLEKFVFAISVHSIECWLLPLTTLPPNDKKSPLHCLNKMNIFRRKENKDPLSKNNGKNVTVYEEISKSYRKERQIQQTRNFNDSLDAFLDELIRLRAQEDIKQRLETIRKDREAGDW